MIGWLVSSPVGRTALRYGVVTLAVLLFLLALRRAGERAGRLAERLSTMEKTQDAQRRMLEATCRLGLVKRHPGNVASCRSC